MRYVHFALFLFLTAGQANSQTKDLPVTGKLLNPSDNIPLYNVAPNAFLRSQVPTGILHPGMDGIRLYPLTPSENGFQVQEPTDALAGVVVSDHVDILQNGVITRWFRLSETNRPSETDEESVLGWTFCGGEQETCASVFGPESDEE